MKPIRLFVFLLSTLFITSYSASGKQWPFPERILQAHLKNDTDTNFAADYHEKQAMIVMGKVQMPAVVYEIKAANTTSSKIVLKKNGRLYQLSVPYSKKYVLKLPNETTIYLNSNSKLLIDPSKNYFELSGEGYFKFNKNSNIINTGNNITIKGDSGDCVNLTCYSDYDFEPLLTATLIGGNNVVVSSEKESYTLTPPFNQLVIAKTYIDSITNGNVSEAIMWTKETYRYDNIDPYLLIAQIGRWYKVNIEFADIVARRNISFAGNYKWSFNKTIKELAKNCMDFNFRVEDDRLTVCKYSILR